MMNENEISFNSNPYGLAGKYLYKQLKQKKIMKTAEAKFDLIKNKSFEFLQLVEESSENEKIAKEYKKLLNQLERTQIDDVKDCSTFIFPFIQMYGDTEPDARNLTKKSLEIANKLVMVLNDQKLKDDAAWLLEELMSRFNNAIFKRFRKIKMEWELNNINN